LSLLVPYLLSDVAEYVGTAVQTTPIDEIVFRDTVVNILTFEASIFLCRKKQNASQKSYLQAKWLF